MKHAVTETPSLHFTFLLAALAATLSSMGDTAGATTPTTESTSETVHDLYLMGLYPWSGPWHGGESLLASSTLAVDVVNNRTDVLPGYRLHIVHDDTKLYTPPTKIMILGAACSIVSETIARAAHHWNLVQVSYTSTSPALSDKTQFPKFARVSAPEVVMNPTRVQFLQYFGWSRIATIHQLHPLFAATTEDLIERLRGVNFTIVRSEIFQENPTAQVRNLKENDCRIIVGAFYEDKARKVFCEAYKIGLYGRGVVWILNGWYGAEWWKEDDPSIDCTPEQLAEALEGYFGAAVNFLNP
nr:hypothetical protein BaRGS_001890 [Batillaria attramentaria]